MEKEKKIVIIIILLIGVMIISFSALVLTIMETSGVNGQPYVHPAVKSSRLASLDTLPYTPNLDQQVVFPSYAPRVTQLGLPYPSYTPTPTPYTSYAPRITQLGLPYHTYTPTPTPTPALPPFSEYVTSTPYKPYPVTTVSPQPVLPDPLFFFFKFIINNEALFINQYKQTAI